MCQIINCQSDKVAGVRPVEVHDGVLPPRRGLLATGGMDNMVKVWKPEQFGSPIRSSSARRTTTWTGSDMVFVASRAARRLGRRHRCGTSRPTRRRTRASRATSRRSSCRPARAGSPPARPTRRCASDRLFQPLGSTRRDAPPPDNGKGLIALPHRRPPLRARQFELVTVDTSLGRGRRRVEHLVRPLPDHLHRARPPPSLPRGARAILLGARSRRERCAPSNKMQTFALP